MKAVLDTNVLVSGILFMGPPHRILLAWSEGRFELVFTSDIHEEYRRVAAELQQQFPRVDLAAALDLVLVNAHAFPSAALKGQVCADPDDDKFLACALASGGIIVSGDKHLLDVTGYRGIEVLPRVPSSDDTWRLETTSSHGHAPMARHLASCCEQNASAP